MSFLYEKKLTDNDLNTINGGVFSQEAGEWFERNKYTISERAVALNDSNLLLSFLIQFKVAASEDEKTVYGIDELKEICQQYGIDTSDLV